MDLKTLRLNVVWERFTNVIEVKKKKIVCFIRLLMMHCGRTIYGSEYYIYEWIVKYEWTLQEFKSRITTVSILALPLRIGN